jgi:hypothetical protein
MRRALHGQAAVPVGRGDRARGWRLVGVRVRRRLSHVEGPAMSQRIASVVIVGVCLLLFLAACLYLMMLSGEPL